MAEQDKEEFSFIREKIKEKPLNKKRLLKHGIYAAGLAVVFGTVACFVFTLARPHMERWLYPKENERITFPEDEPDMQTVSSAEEETQSSVPDETEMGAETEIAQEGTETGTEQEPVRELEIADYQKLQDKIYAIGKEANRAVVQVADKSGTDGYESRRPGSGILIQRSDSELLILAEYGVIKDAEKISVTFINGISADAVLRKYDESIGIAVLTVSLHQLDEDTKNEITYALLGNSLSVAQGNVVLAVGNPLGANYSIGTGIITSSGTIIRRRDSSYTVFTTNIAGSRTGGGVLLNMDGEIIGLLVQDADVNEDNGMLAAISISELKKRIEMLSNGIDIPYLGLIVTTVTEQISQVVDLPPGVYVKEALMDLPASDAGLHSGDVIVEMDGEALYSADAYEKKVLALVPGEETELVVSRQGMDEKLKITCRAECAK